MWGLGRSRRGGHRCTCIHPRERPPPPHLPVAPLNSCCSAGAFPANRFTTFMTSGTSVDVSFAKWELVGLAGPECCAVRAAGLPAAACCRGVGGRPPSELWMRPARPAHPPHAHPHAPVLRLCSLPTARPPHPRPTGRQVILGSQYAGCMKQGLFTLMNYWLPKAGVLPLNAGCSVGPVRGDVALFLGLSGACCACVLRGAGAVSPPWPAAPAVHVSPAP